MSPLMAPISVWRIYCMRHGSPVSATRVHLSPGSCSWCRTGWKLAFHVGDADDADHLVHESPLPWPEHNLCAFFSPSAQLHPMLGCVHSIASPRSHRSSSPRSGPRSQGGFAQPEHRLRPISPTLCSASSRLRLAPPMDAVLSTLFVRYWPHRKGLLVGNRSVVPWRGGWIYWLRMRFQCLERCRSQTSFLGLPYCVWVS